MNTVGASCPSSPKMWYITLLFLPAIQTRDDVTWCYNVFNLSVIFSPLASDNEVRNKSMLISALNNKFFVCFFVPILLCHISIHPVLYVRQRLLSHLINVLCWNFLLLPALTIVNEMTRLSHSTNLCNKIHRALDHSCQPNYEDLVGRMTCKVHLLRHWYFLF